MTQTKTDSKLTYSTIVQVANILHSCFKSLNIQVPISEIEALSCFINDVYSTRNRTFHDIYHALEVSENCSPLATISALMHDVVYLQVDRSRIKELRGHFGIFDPGESLNLVIPPLEELQKSPWAEALITVFGFLPGQKLGIFSGLNEMLSGWVTVQVFSKYLTPKQIIHVLAGIEATIPFRGELVNPTVPERLRENLCKALKVQDFEMSDFEIDNAIIDSVVISNNDAKGFGIQEPEDFIHGSWALLYEGNPALQGNFFSICEYREPLQKLEGFLASLNPKKIFTQFKNVPSTIEMEKLLKGAQSNLKIGREYVQSKLLDTAILEAFAMISGGDCPLELFTGPKPITRETVSARIEHFIDWKTINADSTGKDERVIRLLNNGRAFRSKFDVKTSLFAAYIYLGLTPDQFKASYALACQFFKKEIRAEDFLNGLPEPIVLHIGTVVSHIAWTRSAAINEYLEKRKSELAKAS